MGLFFSKEKLINIMELLVQKLLVAFMDRFMNLTFKKKLVSTYTVPGRLDKAN